MEIKIFASVVFDFLACLGFFFSHFFKDLDILMSEGLRERLTASGE